MGTIMTIRAPEDFQELLKQLAKKRGYTRNGLVMKVLQEWVKTQEKKIYKNRKM